MDELWQSTLSWAIVSLARIKGRHVGELQLSESIRSNVSRKKKDPVTVSAIAQEMGWKGVVSFNRPDRAHVPLLCLDEGRGWGLITGVESSSGGWQVQRMEGQEVVAAEHNFQLLLAVDFEPPAVETRPGMTFRSRLNKVIGSFKGYIVEAAVASMFVNVLASFVSFYSMQVYDKVIPTRGINTLLALFSGVALLVFCQWMLQFARSRVMDKAIYGIDNALSREIFQRLLKVRIDQMPGSVGSLANQIRGHEQVRNFYTASTLYVLVDIPAALIFVFLIGFITNVQLSIIPLIFAVIALLTGIYYRIKINKLTTQGQAAVNQKMGLLVEAVEGAETLKSNQGGWTYLGKWMGVNKLAISSEMDLKRASESLAHFVGFLQQISYIVLISVGAWYVLTGDITMGALIGASILGGRVLASIMALPGLLVQHGHARAAISGLEGLYQLKSDNHEVDKPLTPQVLSGRMQLENVRFSYKDAPPAISVGKISIKPGERIGVIGPIGSGKSTLMKVLAGLYVPQAGRVLIDDLDMHQVAPESIARNVGYIQQDHRLFQGTLRENLLMGLLDPGDDELLRVARETGLSNVISSHPRGMDLPINEGGGGLSGGQKQLVAFTRMLLANPSIILLDEPTSAMDEASEKRCIDLLASEEFKNRTLVLTTHKPQLLSLVDRLIVVVGGRVALDGPKDEVFQALRAGREKLGQAPASSGPATLITS